ncbi:helix-turn-helix domain-containing protein [Neorhizobium alkalisoli]|uniref:AraC family transcriptional regulator n=1 Tax=Neorhizobium alkalisoli TaxID=528178 RepID=A0A561QRX0_9HYPH|nr:AraC family transcriptional regulator [Neorhizobium alkalisoli]TWF53089.1 AraC family transcriptional regulator [Neorhizobium alkalisoli]
MLTVPLPFLAGLVFALALHQSLKGADVPGSRRYFTAFLILYALQGLIVGLHFGYGVSELAPVQPVTAAAMPPLAFLAFRELTGVPSPSPFLHLLPPVLVLCAVIALRPLVDPLLLGVFIAYGIALWRLTRTDDEDLMAEAKLERMRPALRAARLTAALMFFFAAGDAAIAIHAAFNGPGSVPFAITVMNIVGLATVGLFYISPQRALQKPQPVADPAPEDAAIVARATAALDAGDLYRDENLSLAKFARKAGIPARDLSSVLNRVTGLNVSQFVNNRRVGEACRLLEETSQPATAIMFDAGFSTKSNFNREFRRVTGMSPRQWRAARRSATIPANNGLDLVAAKKQLGNVQP